MEKELKAPKLRFPGFTDDWEQRKFCEIANRQSESVSSDRLNPFVEYEDVVSEQGILNKDLYSKDGNKKGIKFTSEDVLYGKLRPYLHNWLSPDFSGVAVGDWWVLRPIKTDKKFLFMLIQTTQFDFVANQSVGTKMPRADWNLISNIEFYIPKSNEEQKKVGNFFSQLDKTITLHQRKLDTLKKLKKGFLQKMFPKNGESVPEIRFPGFTDAWEQRKFGDLADYKKGPFGSAITKDMFVPRTVESVKVYEQQNAINKDWSLERYFLPKEYVCSKLKSFEVKGGDIIVSCAGTIGEIYEIPKNAEPGVINQALMRIRVNENIVDKKMFIIAFSNMINDFTRTHSNGSAIKNIPPFADLKPMEVLMPSLVEQCRISGYFSNLDNLITLHQRKLDTLKKFKQGMLQQMFI